MPIRDFKTEIAKRNVEIKQLQKEKMMLADLLFVSKFWDGWMIDYGSMCSSSPRVFLEDPTRSLPTQKIPLDDMMGHAAAAPYGLQPMSEETKAKNRKAMPVNTSEKPLKRSNKWKAHYRSASAYMPDVSSNSSEHSESDHTAKSKAAVRPNPWAREDLSDIEPEKESD